MNVAKSGAPLRVEDIFKYTEEYVRTSSKVELIMKIRKFIREWHSVEGNHETRWQHAILACAEQHEQRCH